VRIVGHRELAEDVLQEALIKAWQARAQLREEERFNAWLLRIGTREAMAAARVQRLEWGRREPAEETALADGRPDPAQAAELSEQAGIVWKAMAELSPRQRAVFVICAVEARALAEAAASLGITTGSAKRHLSRAREKLRHRLARISKGSA
jgi:RNA polymerase sigma-70 factor (ECF subfamily)